ncbi:hypothetical protein BMS3Bbin14_01616 [bacterium BMS3Bbin14]|nr:hypothetical protein BMS3Bbin14_01616 [bacterium BMS3Bbin14]HDO29994.1 AMIN domain-containing protein [Desulfobacteraceae bacterium]
MKKIIPVILFQLGILFFYTCPATAATRPLLTAIQFESPSGREDRVIFTLNGIARPRIFEIKGKRPRLVVDLPDTGLARRLKNTTKTKGHFVHRIRLGIHRGKNPRTRVVLDLAPNQPIHFDQHFNRENNILIISIYAAGGKTKPAATTNAQAQAPPAKKPGTTISLQPADRKEFVPPAAPQQAEQKIITTAPIKKHLVRKKQSRKKKAVAAAPVKGIRFSSPTASEDQVTFKLNGPDLPKIFALTGAKPRIVFDFPDPRLAAGLKNTIETNGHFIQRIRIARYKGNNPKTRVVLDLVPHQSTDFGQHFNRKDNILTISISAAGNKPKAAKTTGNRAAAAMAEPPPAGIAPTGQQAAGQQPKKPEARIPAPSLLPRQSAQKPAATAAVEQGIPESVSPAVPARPAEKTAKVIIPPLKPAPVREKQTAIKSSPPPGQLKKPAPTGKTAPVIKSIKFDNRSSRGEIVRFQLNGFYPPTVMGLKKNAPRVGCDFKNATVPGSVKKLIECNGKYVKTIQVEPSHNPDRVKVILNLVPGNKYDLQQIFFKKDNLFIIIINTVNKKILM